MEEYMTNENDLTQTEKNLRNFLQNGAAVKKLIDEYIANNENSITCDFCKKQYYLRTKVVHEKHCLVRLALESTMVRWSSYVLMSYGIWRSRDQVEKKEWYLYELRSLFQSRWEVKCCKYC